MPLLAMMIFIGVIRINSDDHDDNEYNDKKYSTVFRNLDDDGVEMGSEG